MHKQVSFFICFLSFVMVTPVTGSDVELKNLRWEWEAYDQNAGDYVPYFKHDRPKAIRFNLDLNKYRSAYFKLNVPNEYFVWIQEQIVMSTKGQSATYFSIDSLFSIYKTSQVYLTIYSHEFDGKLVESSIVNKSSVESLSVHKDNFLKRKGNKKLDLFIILSAATLSLIALFRSFNFRLFQEYFSLRKSLQLRQNFDLITAHAPLAWPNIGFVIFYASVAGATALTFDLFLTDDKMTFPFDLSDSTGVTIGLKVTAYCFLLMLGKLVLISIGTELFKLKKIRAIHFFTYFRLSLIMAIIAFSLSILNGIFGGVIVEKGWGWIQLCVTLLWIGRSTLIFFVLNKIYTFRKLHLFSYLCSSELIPLLLFFKIFLK